MVTSPRILLRPSIHRSHKNLIAHLSSSSKTTASSPEKNSPIAKCKHPFESHLTSATALHRETALTQRSEQRPKGTNNFETSREHNVIRRPGKRRGGPQELLYVSDPLSVFGQSATARGRERERREYSGSEGDNVSCARRRSLIAPTSATARHRENNNNRRLKIANPSTLGIPLENDSTNYFGKDDPLLSNSDNISRNDTIHSDKREQLFATFTPNVVVGVSVAAVTVGALGICLF